MLWAARRPVALATLLALVVLAVVVGASPLVALVPYGAVVGAYLVHERTRTAAPGSFRERELLKRLPPNVRTRVARALASADSVNRALDQLRDPPAGMAEQVASLAAAVLELGREAGELDAQLQQLHRGNPAAQLERARSAAGTDPQQQEVVAALERRVAAIEQVRERRASMAAQIDAVSAQLDGVEAALVQARLDATGAAGLSQQLQDLRDRSEAMALARAEVAPLGSDGGSDATTQE